MESRNCCRSEFRYSGNRPNVQRANWCRNLWLIVTAVGYCAFIVPGVILHIACVYNAYHHDPTKTDEAKPLAAQPARAPYDPQKSVWYKIGRVWSRMTTRTTPSAVAQSSVFCSSCGKYTTSRTAFCNRCGKRLSVVSMSAPFFREDETRTPRCSRRPLYTGTFPRPGNEAPRESQMECVRLFQVSGVK